MSISSANITTNAAAIELSGASSMIQGSFAADALANLANNSASGSLTTLNGRNLTTPAFSNAGNVTVGTGTTFSVAGAYTQTGGTTTVQENGTLDPTGDANVNGGVLTGSGTVAANVINAGTINPGNPGGTLNIAGDFSQSGSGTLNLEMAAAPSFVPQAGFDQLSITGAASFGGTLNVDSIGGFVPNPGDEFQVISFASRTGEFGTENLNLGGSVASTVFEPTRVLVRIAAAPPAAGVTGLVLNGGSPNRSGIATLTLQFSEAVTVTGASSLELWNLTTGAAVDISGATLQNNGTAAVTWNLSGIALPDGNYTATIPKTEGLAATFSSLFHVLAGDSNGSTGVEFGDFGELANAFNTSGPVYGPGDMNGDGSVDFGDFGILANGFNNVLSLPLHDFGDAAAPFPTVLPDGARHLLGAGLILGATVDAETDGQPDAAAAGDGADEDGVTFATLQAGSNAAITVTATVPGTAVLNAWIDFNADGDWDDTGEQIFIDQTLNNGTNNLTAAIPSGATAGQVFARFRTSSIVGYSHSGLARDGEVEDYFVTVVAALSRSALSSSALSRSALSRSAEQSAPAAMLDFWTGAVADPSQSVNTNPAFSSVKPQHTAVVDLAIKEVASSQPTLAAVAQRSSQIDASLIDQVFEQETELLLGNDGFDTGP